MSLKELTEEEAIQAIRDFFREKPFLFLGTGMSCALEPKFGMPALRDALVSGIQDLSGNQQVEWKAVVKALGLGADLESALDHVSDQALLEKITNLTGDYIAELDKEFARKIATGEVTWPAITMLKKLVETLPESDRALHVLTPNYDLLLEYACDIEGVPYTNGFFGGVERREDWGAASRALSEPEWVTQGRKKRIVRKLKKHVRLYKVHGSLNYFLRGSGIVENNSWIWGPPDFYKRVMITPGLLKYETLQKYRTELLRHADKAIEKATHFLFLGYGFNDTHLEVYVRRKLSEQSCHGLIITKDINENVCRLLESAKNLWVVCRIDNGAPDGSRIYNRGYRNWLMMPEKDIWKIDQFTNYIFGE